MIKIVQMRSLITLLIVKILKMKLVKIKNHKKRFLKLFIKIKKEI